MSLKKLICLCLITVAGGFGVLGSPKAMAQGGHGIVSSAAPLTQADVDEIKGLMSSTLIPALGDMQLAMGSLTTDPDQACRLGKAADSKLLDYRRRLMEVYDRLKKEGKDVRQLDNMLTKIDALMVDGKKPSDIYCNAELALSQLNPQERAILTKLSGYGATYLRLMGVASKAMLDKNKPLACSNLNEAYKVLLQMDDMIQSLRQADIAKGLDVSSYDSLLTTNKSNRQRTADMINQTCAAS